MSRADPPEPGSVVIVTGASSGIGRATSRLLSEQGMRVVLASRSRTALEAAQGECRPGATLVVPTDVASAAEVEALFEAAVAAYGRVDAVVHSAAVLAYGRFDDVPAEVFDHALDVTLSGTANVARVALRQFAQQGGGRLVVVGSLLGKIATPYMSSYVTAKWGVQGLVRCLQIEARETPGVEVSLVSPGAINTPVYLQAGSYAGVHGRPPPPVVSPERVARAIAKRLERPAPGHQCRSGERVDHHRFPRPAVRLRPHRHATHAARRAGRRGRGHGRQRPATAARERVGARSVVRPPRRAALPRRAPGRIGPRARGGPGRREDDMTEKLTTAGRRRVVRRVHAPAEAVWAVVSDGWLYANWVVGHVAGSRRRRGLAGGRLPDPPLLRSLAGRSSTTRPSRSRR